MCKQEYSKAKPAVRVVGDPTLELCFEDYEQATTAWLMLSTMHVPASLDAGADGWVPNTQTIAWRDQICPGEDWTLIPDMMIAQHGKGYLITSSAMRCEITAKADSLWETVFEIITEYRDRVESGCWEVQV